MSAPHIYQHTSGYIFRYCIPADIQPLFQKKELRYSLKTGSLRCAKTRASSMVSFIRSLVDDLRISPPDSIIVNQLTNQIKNKFNEITGQKQKPLVLGEGKSVVAQEPVASGPKLSEVLDRYVADAQKAQQWSRGCVQYVHWTINSPGLRSKGCRK